MSTAVRARAPGKLMIAGEYAVLDGAEAVIAAVDRHAYVELGTGAEGELPREVGATRACVEARLGRVDGALALDVSELQQDGKKLGLGSSAAAAAACAGALVAAKGRDLREPDVRALTLELALEGHRAIAPQGSGADVAASVLGGFVRFRKLGDGVETHALTWPAALYSVVVWTGQPARTSDFVAKVNALAAANATLHRERMSELAAESDQLVSALLASDVSAALESFHAYGTAMGALGEAAGVPILDAGARTVRELAAKLGGAAKPSGAGGGDVVLALFAAEEAAAAFRSACAEHRLSVVPLALGVEGVGAATS